MKKPKDTNKKTPNRGDDQMLPRFLAFHKDNPHIWEMFDRFARELVANGHSRFGACAIFNEIRWYTATKTTDKELKLNDHHATYYARLFN